MMQLSCNFVNLDYRATKEDQVAANHITIDKIDLNELTCQPRRNRDIVD
jgi:hypothetical protein